MVDRGEFREDLYYRLNVGAITLPPLRSRIEDIDLLCSHFLQRLARRLGKDEVVEISDPVLGMFRAHPWPGNIRQLLNVMERALIVARGPSILPQHLPAPFLGAPRRRRSSVRVAAGAESIEMPRRPDFDLSIEAAERDQIRKALEAAGGKRMEAARCSGSVDARCTASSTSTGSREPHERKPAASHDKCRAARRIEQKESSRARVSELERSEGLMELQRQTGSGDAGARVLIVEDHPMIAELVETRLRIEGMRPTKCLGGREAIQVLAHADFDLVILDIMMPEVDGYEVFKVLKSQERTAQRSRDLPDGEVDARRHRERPRARRGLLHHEAIQRRRPGSQGQDPPRAASPESRRRRLIRMRRRLSGAALAVGALLLDPIDGCTWARERP